MNSNYLTTKSTISDIERKLDKNANRYFRLSVKWNQQERIFYAFSTDYSLKEATLKTLTNAPENFINRLTLITYEELENKQNNFTFARIKDIQIT